MLVVVLLLLVLLLLVLLLVVVVVLLSLGGGAGSSGEIVLRQLKFTIFFMSVLPLSLFICLWLSFQHHCVAVEVESVVGAHSTQVWRV